jgi:CRP/FNR family transcriptional regulator
MDVAAGLAVDAAASRHPSAPPALGKDRIPLLAGIPLFEGLSRRHLGRLAKLAGEARFREGAMMVQAGRPGLAFHVILEGRARVVHGVLPTGRTIVRLGPGDYFGELALLDGGPRSASVVADTPVTTMRLPRGEFRRILRSEPDIALKLLQGLATRLRDRTLSVVE